MCGLQLSPNPIRLDVEDNESGGTQYLQLWALVADIQ